MFDYYGKLSTEVYDISKPIGLSFGDVEYYKKRLQNCSGKILEPAVGTGRIAIPLLEDGFDIEGFDCSEEMLNLCRKKCKKRNLFPELFICTMESFKTDKKYDAIIIPTGSFLLIKNRNDSIKALELFYKHLNNNARLIVDIFLQKDFEVGRVIKRSWEKDNGQILTLEEKQVKIDYINQYTTTYNSYKKIEGDVLIQNELEEFSLRWYGVEEFKMILENIGFKDIVISSDYVYDSYPTNETNIITFEAYARY